MIAHSSNPEGQNRPPIPSLRDSEKPISIRWFSIPLVETGSTPFVCQAYSTNRSTVMRLLTQKYLRLNPNKQGCRPITMRLLAQTYLKYIFSRCYKEHFIFLAFGVQKLRKWKVKTKKMHDKTLAFKRWFVSCCVSMSCRSGFVF